MEKVRSDSVQDSDKYMVGFREWNTIFWAILVDTDSEFLGAN